MVSHRTSFTSFQGALVTVTAVLDLTLSPESLAEAPRVLRETLQATRAFPGCAGVEVLRDTDDP